MSEQMPYIPYGEDGDWKKRFEMTIPILLLILVFVVVAWKMNLLVGVPFIGDLFKGPNIDIAVIGNDQNLIKVIETDIRKDLPVNIKIFNKADLYGIRDVDTFAKYNMIIMTEGQDGDTIELERYTLEYLKSFVDSGKPAIVIGFAGNKIAGSPQGSGWNILGFVPAACKSSECKEETVSFGRVTMYVRDINHPILKEFVEPLNFSSGQITYYLINPSGGTSILDIEIVTGAKTDTGTAIVERTGGKVIYFAFHPALYPPLLHNTIQYLR
jgi:hypothetical protein